MDGCLVINCWNWQLNKVVHYCNVFEENVQTLKKIIEEHETDFVIFVKGSLLF